MATEDYTTYTEYDPFEVATVQASSIASTVEGDKSFREVGVYRTIPEVSALAAVSSVTWNYQNLPSMPRPATVCVVGFHNAVPTWPQAAWPEYSIIMLHSGSTGAQPIYLRCLSQGFTYQIGSWGASSNEKAQVRLSYANGLLTGELWTNYEIINNSPSFEHYSTYQLQVPHINISEVWGARIQWLASTVGRMTVSIGALSMPAIGSGGADMIGDGELEISPTPIHRLRSGLEMIGEGSIEADAVIGLQPTDRRRPLNRGLALGTNWV